MCTWPTLQIPVPFRCHPRSKIEAKRPLDITEMVRTPQLPPIAYVRITQQGIDWCRANPTLNMGEFLFRIQRLEQATIWRAGNHSSYSLSGRHKKYLKALVCQHRTRRATKPRTDLDILAEYELAQFEDILLHWDQYMKISVNSAWVDSRSDPRDL
jgi:hypothetical protein